MYSRNFVGALRRLRLVEDDERLALAGLREAVDEVAVDRAADAEREDVGVAEVLADVLEHRGLLGDVAVGDDDEAARHVLARRAAAPSRAAARAAARCRRRRSRGR